MGFVSDDLVNFKSLGRVAEVLPEAKEWTGESDIWAPDIVKVGDEYRLYCSNSTLGVQQSCIFLAVSDKAEGPYMIYNKETDYYYLFVSYGSLKTDYNSCITRYSYDESCCRKISAYNFCKGISSGHIYSCAYAS